MTLNELHRLYQAIVRDPDSFLVNSKSLIEELFKRLHEVEDEAAALRLELFNARERINSLRERW